MSKMKISDGVLINGVDPIEEIENLKKEIKELKKEVDKIKKSKVSKVKNGQQRMLPLIEE